MGLKDRSLIGDAAKSKAELQREIRQTDRMIAGRKTALEEIEKKFGIVPLEKMDQDERTRKLKAFDEMMRERFCVKWAPPVPVDLEDADPAAAAELRYERERRLAAAVESRAGEQGAGTGSGVSLGEKEATPGSIAGKGPAGNPRDADSPEILRTKPNRKENEFMFNLMILRNALVAMGPLMKERAKRAGKTCWRDLRLMTILVEKVQEQLITTMPKRRDEYYQTYAQHGHYELRLNGPIRNPRMVLISDKYLGALCEVAMKSECVMCMREGSEIAGCMLRQALLEVAPPREVQDGRWARCEYRSIAGNLIRDEVIEI